MYTKKKILIMEAIKVILNRKVKNCMFHKNELRSVVVVGIHSPKYSTQPEKV